MRAYIFGHSNRQIFKNFIYTLWQRQIFNYIKYENHIEVHC